MLAAGNKVWTSRLGEKMEIATVIKEMPPSPLGKPNYQIKIVYSGEIKTVPEANLRLLK